MTRKAAILLAVLTLGGCAASGTAFEWDNARKVTVGMTEADLVRLLGKPNSVTTRGDMQVWSWVYVSASPLGVSNRHVTFPLKDGKVTAVPNLSTFQ